MYGIFKLKNNKDYLIRKGQPADSAKFIEYLKCISTESDNLTLGLGEISFDVKEKENFIEETLHSDRHYFVIAEYQGQIIGNINFTAGNRPRTAHAGEFGVSVRKEFWGNGIAYELIKGLIEWAEQGRKIKKINLKVREDNERAISLYKKLGFEVEGLVSRTFYIKGKYYGAYHMGKIIN